MSENENVISPCDGPTLNPSFAFGDFREGELAFINDPIDSFSQFHPPEYKIIFPVSMEAQIRKLKLSMETWREVIIKANSILLWEKQWHLTALLSNSTILFFLLYIVDPSPLSMIAFTGLLLTLADCFLPPVLASVFKPEEWTKEQQKDYEDICTNIIMQKMKIELLVAAFFRLRVTNSKVFFAIIIGSCLVLIWIGNNINNLLLMYMVCTFLITLPGMLHHGMLGKISDVSSNLFTSLIENAKSKVATVRKMQ